MAVFNTSNGWADFFAGLSQLPQNLVMAKRHKKQAGVEDAQRKFQNAQQLISMGADPQVVLRDPGLLEVAKTLGITPQPAQVGPQGPAISALGGVNLPTSFSPAQIPLSPGKQLELMGGRQLLKLPDSNPRKQLAIAKKGGLPTEGEVVEEGQRGEGPLLHSRRKCPAFICTFLAMGRIPA